MLKIPPFKVWSYGLKNKLESVTRYEFEMTDTMTRHLSRMKNDWPYELTKILSHAFPTNYRKTLRIIL